MKIIFIWIIPVVILLTVFLDAMRDRWLPKICRGEAWLEWHLVKWAGFFLPLILLSYLWLDFYHFQLKFIIGYLLFAVICNILWKFLYNYKKG